jgi:hypothetical protein
MLVAQPGDGSQYGMYVMIRFGILPVITPLMKSGIVLMAVLPVIMVPAFFIPELDGMNLLVIMVQIDGLILGAFGSFVKYLLITQRTLIRPTTLDLTGLRWNIGFQMMC